ncbi:MAG: carboxypeptidase-like regulatory domain-containing protein, partial [Thermoanaerobaculia bacterium]|nr:carboxypeptidase-like regulatory domain-containing protein [Thermoanaerobaculia bacterium]
CTPFAHTWKALSLLAGLSLTPNAVELMAQTPQKITVTEIGTSNIKKQIRPADKPVRYLAGTVRSRHDDMPLKNVRVRFEEGGKSVRTDKNGRFKIILPEDIAVEYVTVAVSTRRDYKPFHKKIKVVALPAEGLIVELREKREGVIMGTPRVFF